MHGQDVAITGGDPVGLSWVSLGSDQLDLQGRKEGERNEEVREEGRSHSFSMNNLWQYHTYYTILCTCPRELLPTQ